MCCIMARMLQEGYIGVFDSGVGGISVLKRLAKLLPHEHFVFYGDSANTPYGDKPTEWVMNRSRLITERMLDTGAKAIVIACNTATSVAAETLRGEHPPPGTDVWVALRHHHGAVQGPCRPHRDRQARRARDARLTRALPGGIPR